MKTASLIILIVMTSAVGSFAQCCSLAGSNSTLGASTNCAGTYYACPSHPDVTSDKATNCPKCGGLLVEKTRKTNNKSKKNVSYSCNTHSEISQQTKRKCPKCGEKLKKEKEYSFN